MNGGEMKCALLLPISLITTVMFSAERPITITNELNEPVIGVYECLYRGQEAHTSFDIGKNASRVIPNEVTKITFQVVSRVNLEPIEAKLSRAHKSFVIKKLEDEKIGVVPKE